MLGVRVWESGSAGTLNAGSQEELDGQNQQFYDSIMHPQKKSIPSVEDKSVPPTSTTNEEKSAENQDKQNQQFFESIMSPQNKADSSSDVPKIFHCPKCPHKTLTSHTLSWHMKIRHFFGQFFCPHCGSSKEYADELIAHMKEDGHPQDPGMSLVVTF